MIKSASSLHPGKLYIESKSLRGPRLCPNSLGPKGTHLYSNYDCVGELYVPLPRIEWEAELVTKLLATKPLEALLTL